jgi:hypothetical protein
VAETSRWAEAVYRTSRNNTTLGSAKHAKLILRKRRNLMLTSNLG